jgi:hypothetical protein
MIKEIKFKLYKLSLYRLCPVCWGFMIMMVRRKEWHCKCGCRLVNEG